MPQIIAAVGAAMTAVAVGIGKALTAFGVSAYTAGVIGGLAVKYGVQIAIVWATSKLLAPKLDNVGARQADVLELSLGEHPREAIFGRAATGGTLIDAFNWGGSQNDWEAMVIALADHECHALVGFYVDDKYVAHVGNGNVSGYSDSNGAALQVFFLPGTMTQTLPGTVGAGPNALSFVSASGGRWTADDRLLGVAAVIVCYRFTPEILRGRPSFRWVVDGKKCYDPRKDSTVTGGSGSHRWNDPTTHEWTEDAALCRYNYLRGVYTNGQLILGPGRTAEEAPPEDVIAAANLCDENVPLKAGGTVKRYTVSAVVRADEPWIDVEEAFAAAMGAELIERSGMIVIDPGAAKTVAKTFVDADLLEDFPVEVQGKLSRRDLVNTVTATYVDPAQMYEEQTAPIRRLLADITADGETRDRALALRFVTSANQAQRLGEIERRKARLQRTANVCLGPRYSVLEVGDWVTWQGSIYNALADRTYMVISAAVDDAQRITLGLREIASSVYSWTPASDELDVNVPSFVAPTPPDGWSTGSNNVLWSDIFGTGRPADHATVNRVFAQASAPAGAVDGDVWHDTAANPQITYYRVGGVWVTGPNLATNTNQLTDGAQLGSTAIWPQVTGTGRPADNATVGARTGVNLRNTADTVTLGDGDVITAQGTAADFAGRQWGATATEDQARNVNRGNSDNVIPDPEFRDRQFWNFPATFVGADSDGGWSQRRIIRITESGNFDVYSGYFAVEPGETYIIRVRIWNNTGGWSGAFWPLIHMPQVAWYSLKHGGGVDPSVADASNAIVAAGDTLDLTWRHRNPTGVAGNANREWQFRFKGSGIPAGQTIAIAVSITRASRLGGLVVREDGTTVLTDAAAVTALGTAADFAGRGALATANTAAWGSQISGRPTELTDGRVAAGLDASGDVARNLTESRLNSSNVLRRSSGGLYTGDLAATVGARAGTNLFRSDGSTVMTQAEVRTAEGTAADFVGRGPWATEQTPIAAVTRPRPNIVRNGGPSLPLGRTGWMGAISNWTVSNSVFLEGPFFSRVLTFTSGLTEYLNSALMPCAPGQPISVQAQVGIFGGWARSEFYPYVVWYTAGGAYIGETGHGGYTAPGTYNWRQENLIPPAGAAQFAIAFVVGNVTGNGVYSELGFWKVKAEYAATCSPWSDEADATNLFGADFALPGAVRDGGTTFGRSSIVTAEGTAADFTGRGALATANTAAWGSQISGRPNFLTDTITADGEQRLNTWYVRHPSGGGYLTERWPAELGANVTETRTAADFTGRQWGATATEGQASNARVPLGSNSIINSEFARGTYSWASLWNGSTGAGVTQSIEGTERRALRGAANGSWANGQAFEIGSGGPDARYWLPVKEGDRVFASALLAYNSACSLAQVNIHFYDRNGNYQGEVGTNGGAANNAPGNNPANYTRVTHFATIGANVAFANVRLRAATNGGASPVAWAMEPMLCLVDAAQTQAPLYVAGRADVIADQTSSNTAADFAGRGALATANYYRQASDPGAVTDGSLWTDTSVTPNVLKQRISGVWQTLATANTVAAQLYATVSPKARVKTRSGTGSATTDTVTVTASGGSGGYTYAWTQQAGSSATATAATSATTAFQYTLVGLGEENVTTWECVVTDSAGAKASALVRAVFVETS